MYFQQVLDTKYLLACYLGILGWKFHNLEREYVLQTASFQQRATNETHKKWLQVNRKNNINTHINM